MSCAQMVAAGHCTILRLNAKKAENEIQKIYKQKCYQWCLPEMISRYEIILVETILHPFTYCPRAKKRINNK